MPSFISRLKSGWNAFQNRDPTPQKFTYESAYSYRPDRRRPAYGNERTIINSIYTKIAVTASSVKLIHAVTDENGQFISKYYGDGNMNELLTLNANMNQTGKAFLVDAVYSLLQEGDIAIIPVGLSANPWTNSTFKIYSWQVAEITKWYPDAIKVKVFNEQTNKMQEIMWPKSAAAIIHNPFYSVMNEQNSTLKRLNRKLVLSDITDEQNSSGRLDLIIQLPYSVKSENRRKIAENRINDIETQLSGTKHGIAYTDGTEKVTQLNRSIENQLQAEIEYLTKMLYGQLSISEEILNGTASEQVMLNFYSNVIEPILDAIVDEINRKFISKTARSQGQAVLYFRDPFKLVPISNFATVAQSLIMSEIVSSNEMRGVIGYMPSSEPQADQLANPNINTVDQQQEAVGEQDIDSDQEEEYINEEY